MTRIAVVGLGEAGATYARGLAAAGASVRGYDYSATAGADIRRSPSLAHALEDADVVLSLVWARTAVEAAEAAMPLLHPDAVYADLNTAARDVKQRVAEVAEAHGVAMTDVAVLAPVSRAAERTPLLASGVGAGRFAAAVTPYGVPVETLPGPAGDAAERKLLRSVFMKGMAAVVVEALEAARAVGAEDWLHEQMAAELGPGGASKVDHLVHGTYRHAVRREHEVRDALAALEADGRAADMTRAAAGWYARIAAEARQPPGPVLDPLLESGLVERTPDPGHGRRILLRLTAAGARAVDEISPRVAALEETMLDGLDPDARGLFADLLRHTRHALETR